MRKLWTLALILTLITPHAVYGLTPAERLQQRVANRLAERIQEEERRLTDLEEQAARRRAERLGIEFITKPEESIDRTTIRKSIRVTPTTTRRLLREEIVQERRRLRLLRQQTEERSHDALANHLKKLITELTNEERADHNLPPLERNTLLDTAAQAHANDLMARGYFDHVSPEGEKPSDRIQSTGYLDIQLETCNCGGYRYTVGENIAKGQRTPQAAVQAWMDSPPHREAILSDTYTEIGVGVVDSTIWVQTFGNVDLLPLEKE